MRLTINGRRETTDYVDETVHVSTESLFTQIDVPELQYSENATYGVFREGLSSTGGSEIQNDRVPRGRGSTSIRTSAVVVPPGFASGYTASHSFADAERRAKRFHGSKMSLLGRRK
jgi:hypothetical protein